MGKFIDLSGQRFGRLLVIKRQGDDGFGHASWLCRCDCGNSAIVSGIHLRSGHTSSCNCLAKEKAIEARTSHGMSSSRLYTIWVNMRERCCRETCDDYSEYGARGITVCAEWLESFEAFRDWALSNGYRDDLTIERKNVNGNYSPENCRWATQKEQANNTRFNRLITYNGVTHTLSQWADIQGLSYDLLRKRLDRGWPIDKALTTSPRR